jgi:chromate transport protein ChrA
MSRHRLAIGVVVLGAIACSAWAIDNLRPVLQLFGEGSGFFGGASTTVDALWFVVAPVIALVLASRVRERTGPARLLRRTHIVTSLAVAGLVLAFAAATISGLVGNGIDGFWFFVAAFVATSVWLPLQTFFATGFVGLLIDQRRTAS